MKIPSRRKWQPTPVFLPKKSHGQRSMGGYSPWGCKRVRYDLVIKQQLSRCDVCVLSRFSHVWVCNPMDHSLPGSSVHGFSRLEYWNGLPCLPPGNLPDPGTEPASSVSPALQADSLVLSHQGSFPGNSIVKNQPANAGDVVRSLSQEDPLE